MMSPESTEVKQTQHLYHKPTFVVINFNLEYIAQNFKEQTM